MDGDVAGGTEPGDSPRHFVHDTSKSAIHENSGCYAGRDDHRAAYGRINLSRPLQFGSPCRDSEGVSGPSEHEHRGVVSLAHDRSPRIDKLRTGRILPATRR